MTHPTSDDCPDANGMPMLGLGTWENTDPETCVASVETALEAGYRHIDTAQAYDNEALVGRGLAEADVDRDDVFLATKVWIENLDHDGVIETTEASLERLGVDAVDLLYVHWPAGRYDPTETLRAFERLRDRGSIDRIGVSNFEPRHVETAREVLDAPIFADQVECHPLLPQDSLRDYAADTDIELVAYSPLARGAVFEDETLSSIAEKYGVSAAQVSLAWLREKGVTAIPKASSEAHLLDNWRSLDLELEPADVDRIDAIDTTRRQVDPGFAPWNGRSVPS